MISIKFYLNGDLTGIIHSQEFRNNEEYEQWLNNMNSSIEIFDVQY